MAPIVLGGKKYSNLESLELDAQYQLTTAAYGYYASGAETESTLKDNRLAFSRIRLLPRFLVDVSHIDTTCTLFGQTLKFPALIAPMAMQRMCHPDGEVAMAHASKNAGSTMILSTMATASIEEVSLSFSSCDNPSLWFQIYVLTRRDITEQMVLEAEKLGYKALVITVDAPRLGKREADEKNNFSLPSDLRLKNLEKIVAAAAATNPPEHGSTTTSNTTANTEESGSKFGRHFSKLIDDSLTWEFIPWIKSITRLPVLIKGILAPDDARKAVQYGIDGIILSNHGGRQLDFAPSAIDMLGYIVDAVGNNKVSLIIDGGIRRGTDIVKCIALGASAVLIGRPLLWALALGGEKGVEDALGMLRDEFELAMALLGCRNIGEITKDYVLMPDGAPGGFVVPIARL